MNNNFVTIADKGSVLKTKKNWHGIWQENWYGSDGLISKSYQEIVGVNLLSANPTKCFNTLNCLSVFDHFVGLALKGLRKLKINFSDDKKTQTFTFA